MVKIREKLWLWKLEVRLGKGKVMVLVTKYLSCVFDGTLVPCTKIGCFHVCFYVCVIVPHLKAKVIIAVLNIQTLVG